MEIYEQIDKKLKDIYKEFKQDKKDLTGWLLLQRLKIESNQESFLSSYLLYRLFEIAWKLGEIINVENLIKFLIKNRYWKEKIIINVGKDTSHLRELHKGIFLEEGILIKTLSFLNLNKTLDFIIKFIVLENEEINPEYYVGKKLIGEYFKNRTQFVEKIIETFEEEYNNKKLSKRGRIIKSGSG